MATHQLLKDDIQDLMVALDILTRQIELVKSRNTDIQDYLRQLNAKVSLIQFLLLPAVL